MTVGKPLLLLAAVVIFWQPIQNVVNAAAEATDGDGILLMKDDPNGNLPEYLVLEVCADGFSKEVTIPVGKGVRWPELQNVQIKQGAITRDSNKITKGTVFQACTTDPAQKGQKLQLTWVKA